MGSTCVIFLGILLNGEKLYLSILLDKQRKALNMLNNILSKCRVTFKELQVPTGYLNFLTKAIVPSRTLSCRLYNKFAAKEIGKNGVALKPHHHVIVDKEICFDCEIW